MERLAMLIDETEKALKDCSMGAKGLYLTLHILAHRKGGDDINNGRPLLVGKEVTPKLLSIVYGGNPSSDELAIYFKELEEVGLFKNGKLMMFYLDNKPLLIIRKSNRKRKGQKYNTGSAQIEMELSSDSSPDRIGKDKKGKDSKSIFNYYREKIQPKVRELPEHFKKIQARLKTYSEAELRKAIDNFSADSWRMENNASMGCSWFFNSDRRIEQFIDMKPRGGVPSETKRRELIYKKGDKK